MHSGGDGAPFWGERGDYLANGGQLIPRHLIRMMKPQKNKNKSISCIFALLYYYIKIYLLTKS